MRAKTNVALCAFITTTLLSPLAPTYAQQLANEQELKAQQTTSSSPKNIIMVIADGMGPVYPVLYRNFKDDPQTNVVEKTVFDRLLVGSSSTYPHKMSGYVTDSAASATALATGVKTYNGAIGVDINKSPLLTVLEYAKIQGKRTGLVSTSQIVHASPASYIAKNESRRNYNEIADDFFDNRAEEKLIADVIIGGGTRYFKRDDRDLVKEFTDSGYLYIDSYEQLETLNTGSQTNVLSLLADIALPSALDSEIDSRLLTMGKVAVAQLENEKHGFVLIIEASQVDWAGHSNDIAYAMGEMDDLAKTMRFFEEYANQTQDTLVVLTADHNTGGVSIGRDGEYKWQGKWLKNLKQSPKAIATAIETDDLEKAEVEHLLGFDLSSDEFKSLIKADDEKGIYQALKSLLDLKTHTGWTTGGHTGVDVPVYAIGPGSDKFSGFQDNTDIGKELFHLLNDKKD
ncbi:alkaline phosphatase [Thalassotalea litorea]|uniref:Alkaline phosphatase n=1 Tax=Thalassotalea litorea TaxID=2020715 RepID=A0A5R9ISN2_9GAMM|nr:alkaline phosphatase [Thalassotalea litorea]TLU66311.1 alkaline phosphatase [Thalassotalea litorea]